MKNIKNSTEFIFNSRSMYKHSQLGYFLDFEVWQDALKLLNFQINQKQKNRHFNTLSMHYYEKLKDNLEVECINKETESYFKTKIASSLFYGLDKEFFFYHYVIPKKGLGLRDYVFFSYPARVLYYAAGLYLLKISQEFLREVHKKSTNVYAFYGGDLCYKGGRLDVNEVNVYYRKYYESFTKKLQEEIKNDKQNKVIIHLDIENYFSEISVSKLMDLLDNFVKPSVKLAARFDLFTKEQILFFFSFLMNGSLGVPQAENNIISSFIGHLYLSFNDLLLDDLLKNYADIVCEHKIIRYVDDICISIKFNNSIGYEKQGEFTLNIASEIAETLYKKLNLRLNLKTRAYHLMVEDDASELMSRVKSLVSQEGAGFDYDTLSDDIEIIDLEEENVDEGYLEESPQEKLDKIFNELNRLKCSNVEEYFIKSNSSYLSEEVFREIFDKRVYNIAKKSENREKLKSIFQDFNFDLIKVRPFEIIIILLIENEVGKKFRDFLFQKKNITISDADMIIKYSCQVGYEDQALFNQLSRNQIFGEIVKLIQNPKTSCDKPGHYRLTCIHVNILAEMPEVIEQMRMRVLNERNHSYSVALNHLLNEIHALCMRKESLDKKQYDANDVFKYLISENIPCETRIKIRNLFDRRNSNGVSHPGSDSSMAWEVTREEYYDYYQHVANCFEQLLF